MRILLVEDEKQLNEVVTKRLKAEHYSVDSCFDGEDAKHYFEFAEYDVVILDIMIPGINGIELLKWIRGKSITTPVLLLTALGTVENRVDGLDAGADDYLVKPFAFDELLARIRVLLRRNQAHNHTSNVFQLANLTVNCDTKEVSRSNEKIKLSSKEFAILEYMIRNQGIVLSREKIEQHIWNYDYQGGSNVVDVYIRYLRKKIDSNYSPKLIHTLRGLGYVLKEDV